MFPPNLLDSPHDALAHGETIVSNKTTPSVPVKTRNAIFLVMNFSSPPVLPAPGEANPIGVAHSNAQFGEVW